jgi:FtsK/SpoIIIE family
LSITPETDAEFAAELIADALIEEARASSGHRRLYLGRFIGTQPAQLFSALLARVDPAESLSVSSATQTIALRAIPLGETETGTRFLVPYLVGEVGQNAGSAGFAALLRDEVPTGDAQRVLLILDDNPVETVRTAAEDAAKLQSLAWDQLTMAATSSSSGTTAVLLGAVLRDDAASRRLPRNANSLASLRRLSIMPDAEVVGRNLDELGCYLSDPRAYQDPSHRLARSGERRGQLESWLAPGQNFEGALTAKYEEITNVGLARVLGAVTPFGLDYSAFTLDDLPEVRRQTRTVRLAYPLAVRGAACASLGTRAAVWKPGGGGFGVALSGAVTERNTASITWSDGRQADVEVVPGDREISITAEGDGWRFAQLRYAGQNADLAVFLDAGQWAPFEATLDLDLGASAFRTSEQPRLLALGPAGALLGQPDLERPDVRSQDGEPEPCFARMGGEVHPIDLLVSSGPEDEDEDDSNIDDDSFDGDTPEETDPTDDEPEPEPPPPPRTSNPPRVASVAHALLKTRQELGSPSFLVTTDDARGLVGNILTPGVFELASQKLSTDIDGLAIEKQILEHPDVTAFIIARTNGHPVLDRHPYLDNLILDSLPAGPLTELTEARINLFEVLVPCGSVHAIAAGIGVEEARAYVDAYHRLLDELLAGGRFSAEHEKVFLYDAVVDPNSGELFIAPTNPLSVAYLLELSEQVDRWLPRAGDVLERDLEALSPRHLIPYFHLQRKWYETGAAAPLLWRRYRSDSEPATSDHRPAYITKRVKHFLRIHPEYADERQTLALAFYEPGDGATVVSALRRLVGPYRDSQTKLPPLPRLQIILVTSSDARTQIEALAGGELISTDQYIATDRLLRDRVEVVRTEAASPPEFAHLSFVFESANSIDRPPATVDVGARAGTLFVGGLAAVPGRHMERDRNETTFMWGTFVRGEQGGALTNLTRKLLELVSGMPRDPIATGRTRMPSIQIGSGFLTDLYASSAWVVHLDKLLGLEAFAPEATGRHARYLIDYEDRLDLAQPGLDAITATSRIAPYRLALSQAFTGLGKATEAGLDRLLQMFNGVSGRWSLDLVGANPNDLNERIGLACAIASLQDLDGGLHGDAVAGLVLPLDEVLEALPSAARPSKGRFCDDLLYVRMPLEEARPVLRCRILEVKYRGSTDAGATIVARRQLERAHSWLFAAFADDTSPQHMFRARDLAELLRAAATRLSAFDLMDSARRTSLEPALDAVARGNFDLRLDYRVQGRQLEGDFVSIEADSAAPAHRQLLPGDGLTLGHLRLGRPALEALAAGRPLLRPPGLATVGYNNDDGEPGSEEGCPGTGDGGPINDVPLGSGSSAASGSEDAVEVAPERSRAEVPIVGARLDAAFAKYGLAVEPFAPELAQVGPSVVRFRTRTLGKLSITEVERRARDLGREIAAPGEVQIGDVPGFVTVDVPRADRETVPLIDVLAPLDREPQMPGALNFVVGVAPSGEVRIADLSRLPHLLVAGATGSGKSVFLRGLLVELLRARTPDQLRLMIIDPKRLDFSAFVHAPHLRGQQIISDPDVALDQLSTSLRTEIDWRQPILENAGVSSAAEFYQTGGTLEVLPQLVILVDEFADLVLAGTDRRAFSEIVQRYAQLTRAYGIFLVLATQRPSVDIITGSIKANLTARVAFSLPSYRDSMTIIDRTGAQDLLGDGDLLFYRNGKIERLQAPFTSIGDVNTAVNR